MELELNWQIKYYHDLTLNEFHDIIALRLQVFVVEQNCAYLDLDGKDKKSYHLIGRDGKGDVIATARILPPGLAYTDAAIGRVVMNKNNRGNGAGHELMKKCVEFCISEFGNTPIRVSAQKHLEEYYNKHDFIPTGTEYLEDGIPQLEMLFTPNLES